jgi:hypothetical protein
MLSRELGEPLANVSYHVKLLADLGCIELVRVDAKRGTLEHQYRAVRIPVIGPDEWMGMPVGVRREITDGIIGRIGEDLRHAVSGGGFDRAEIQATRSRVTLDEEAWRTLSAMLDDVLEVSARLEAETVERGEGETITANLVTLLFEHVTRRNDGDTG